MGLPRRKPTADNPPGLRKGDQHHHPTCSPLTPGACATPLGLHLSTFSVRTGDRLLFFTDGLLETRVRAGRFFRVDQRTDALRRPGLQAAIDELLRRPLAHTRRGPGAVCPAAFVQLTAPVSSRVLRLARSALFARRMALAITGAAIAEKPDGSPRLRSVMRVAPGPAARHV
jgi:Stage II sporulation protein E (SpoIIE)